MLFSLDSPSRELCCFVRSRFKWFYREFTRQTSDVLRLLCVLNLIAFATMVSALKPVYVGRFCHNIAETRSSASVFYFQPNWSWPILKLPLSPFFLPLVPFFLRRLLSLPSLCSFYFTVYPTREFIGSIKNIRLIFWKSLVCILKTVVW